MFKKTTNNSATGLINSFMEVTKQYWLTAEAIKDIKVPIIFVTYEECKQSPIETGRRVALFLGIEFTSLHETKIREFVDFDQTTWKEENGKLISTIKEQ